MVIHRLWTWPLPVGQDGSNGSISVHKSSTEAEHGCVRGAPVLRGRRLVAASPSLTVSRGGQPISMRKRAALPLSVSW